MPKNAKPVKDHEGREFPSQSDMAAHYGLPLSTMNGRLARGWSLEKTLTVQDRSTSKKTVARKPIADHTGRVFPCVREMAEHWGINEKVYWSRKRLLGWPLEKILTTPVGDPHDTANAKAVTDHLGRGFRSVSELCRHWGIGLSTYRERRKRGWDMEQALTCGKKRTEKIEKSECEDHLGNKFPSLSDMCRHYGMGRWQYRSRIKMGWTQKDALTKPYVVNAAPCADPLGNVFPAKRHMANFWGIPPYAVQGNAKSRQDLEGLCVSYWPGWKFGDCVIKTCVRYPWFLCEHKGRPVMLDVRAILDEWHASPEFDPVPGTKPSLLPAPVKCISFPWYLVMTRDGASVMCYWELIQANVDQNFGLKADI